MTELQLLQEYCMSLERENQAKNTQRQTLYNQIQRLQSDLNKVGIQLNQLKHTLCQESSQDDKKIIISLQQQIALLKFEQQHLFNENLEIMDNFQKDHRKLQQVQRENKDLKSQQQQLEKFRMALQRISKTLQHMEKQKYNLTQSNYLLLKENSYLKQFIAQSQQKQYPQHYNTQLCDNPDSMITKSNFLMLNSFQKISEYDEEYEESQNNHEDTLNKSQTGGLYNNQIKQTKSDEKPDSKNRKSLDMINSSYLLMDQKSRQSLENNSLEYEKNTQQNTASLFIEPLAISHNLRYNSNQIYDDASCQVIQEHLQEYQTSSLITSKLQSTSRRNIAAQIQEIQNENQRLRQQYKQLQQNIQILQSHYKKSVDQRQFLQKQIHEMQMNEIYNMKLMENKIEDVINNYERVEQINMEKSQKIQQMEECLQNLQNERQFLCCRIRQYQSSQKQNFKQLNQNQIKSRKRGRSEKNRLKLEEITIENDEPDIFKQLDKGILVQQNNLLIEKISKLEKEKCEIYHQYKATSSVYFPENSENQPPNGQQAFQQNLLISCNNASSEIFQKRSYSSFSENKKFEKERKNPTILKMKQENDQNQRNSRGLKKKIDEIKSENQRLLKSLRIN